METGFRFRCYPTPQQQTVLLQWIGCQRFIYNAKVGEDRYFRTFARKSLSHTGQYAPIDQQYSQFKTELTPWLNDVPSQILRNGAYRWKQTYSRYFQKLGGRPTTQRKTAQRSVWITSELYEFKPVTDAETGELSYTLSLGKGKFPVGQIPYVAHRSHTIPASITVSVDCGKWYVSFCNVDDQPAINPEDIAAELSNWSEADLIAATVGVDRGVAIPFCASTGQRFDVMPVQKSRIARKERSKKRWQRRMARRVKGSNGWRKAKYWAAQAQTYAKNVRLDFAHQTSYRLVDADNATTRLIVFEDLRVKSMTKKPKAKQDESGRWLRNMARAKAGLNKSILASSWSKTRDFAKYKALRANKLVLEVPAHYTSQECSQCGYIHSGNRLTQADFVCQSCGCHVNADDNASTVIAKRGIKVILSGQYKVKDKKKTMRTKQKVGVVCPEPLPETVITPSEIKVSRLAGQPASAQVVDLGNPRLQAVGFSGG
jgi:putative transposase